MKIVGYADRLSVQQGETIRFMVSSELPAYDADIVRLVHGDHSLRGPGFKEEQIPTQISKEYPGRLQPLHKGSYLIVPDSPVLREIDSSTIQAFIYPTTPSKGVQGIVTKWSSASGIGYGLFIDEDGGLALWIGDQQGKVKKIGAAKPLRPSQWYFVVGSFDAEESRAYVRQEPISNWPLEQTRAVVEQTIGSIRIGRAENDLIIAGHWGTEDSGAPIVVGHFNGKIENPRLFGRALSVHEIDSLREEVMPKMDSTLIAAWNFGESFSSTSIRDGSPNQQHGQAVNMPMRAVTGHNWKGIEDNFAHAPEEYGAIRFHDDDLEDAGWQADFELTIPEELSSGVYAARLSRGSEEDYVPFFVRPRKGKATARIAFLVPTFTYLAYANEHVSNSPDLKYIFQGEREYPKQKQDKYIIANGLHSLYDHHSDGSGICYSSRLRPILTLRPKYYFQALGSGKGSPHNLNADLHLVDWLETKGHRHDVITDEDLHFEGTDLLKPYKVIVTGTHPEYWSRQMLDAMDEYLNAGGRLMYLGGNGFYWVTSVHTEKPHLVEVRRWGGTEAWRAEPGEYYHSTTGELGGLWRNRGRPPQKMVGVGFTAQGFDRNSAYKRRKDSFDPRASFIFEGVGNDELIGDFQSLVQDYGAAGFELDRLDHSLGTPPHALLLASSSGHSDAYQHVIEEVKVSDSRQGGPVNPLVKADMVYMEYPNGGTVFSVGSISWCGSLSYNQYNNNVSRITDNVLTKFASDEKLRS